MITDLSDMLVKLREKAILAKLSLKEHILNYIHLSKFKGKCLICDSNPVGLENEAIYKSLKDNCYYAKKNRKNDLHCPFITNANLAVSLRSENEYASGEILDAWNNQEYKISNLLPQNNPIFNAYNSLLVFFNLISENSTVTPINMQIIFECVQNKLCESCIMRTHGFPPSFSLNLNFPDPFLEEVKFLEFLNSLYYQNVNKMVLGNKSFRDENIVDFSQLEDIYDDSPRNSSNDGFFDQLLESYRSRIKRIKLKNIKKQHIKYKINTIKEQIEISLRNYRIAVEKGRFDDAEQFKEVFYNLFNLRIELEERFIGLQP